MVVLLSMLIRSVRSFVPLLRQRHQLQQPLERLWIRPSLLGQSRYLTVTRAPPATNTILTRRFSSIKSNSKTGVDKDCEDNHNVDDTTKSDFGEIHFYNEQSDLPSIDEAKLIETVRRIRTILGYDRYSVTLILVNDEAMQEANLQSRGMDRPTDILSFQFQEALMPGVLMPPEFDVPDFYNLGDMLIDIPYVMRSCKDDEEWEYYDEEEEDRGVSRAMADVFDPETRLHMLLIHGMLHLVGYDHIDDDDFILMVTREEELLRELGLPGAPPLPNEPTTEQGTSGMKP